MLLWLDNFKATPPEGVLWLAGLLYSFHSDILVYSKIGGELPNGESCHCLPPCEETRYTLHHSTMGFPSDAGAELIQKELNLTKSYIQ